jgi:hypothetical protein
VVARRKARAEQRRYEHRLRSRVREHRGCLDALGGTTRRLLGLRAGLEGRPLSHGDAASRLGISSRRATSLERTGLRTLQVACGVSAAPASPGVARLAGSAPALQPASFLVPATSAPDLKPAVALTKPRGSHAVEAASATSRPSGAAGGGPVSVAAALESGSSGPAVAMILALCLATLAVVLLVALRRSVAGRREPQPAAAAAPAPAPPPEPAATYVPPQQSAEQEPPAARPASRAARAATVAATTAVGVIVRELVRRGGGRR